MIPISLNSYLVDQKLNHTTRALCVRETLNSDNAEHQCSHEEGQKDNVILEEGKIMPLSATRLICYALWKIGMHPNTSSFRRGSSPIQRSPAPCHRAMCYKTREHACLGHAQDQVNHQAIVTIFLHTHKSPALLRPPSRAPSRPVRQCERRWDWLVVFLSQESIKVLILIWT
jgi:hypothetical protein